jgi:NAD(P)-dependent dehydrogenase (short-subunit alcohol dehydrogenase family)
MKKKIKITIITGGAGRIGLNLAKYLISKKEKVVIADINKKKLLKIKKEINSTRLETFSTDLSIKKNIDKLINFTLKKFGTIDSAVLCSYPTSKGWGAKIENLEEKYLYEDLQKQLGGTIIFCQRILKYFIKSKKGNLVLVSSIQGIQAPKFDHYKNLKMNSPIEYSAIKAGIISITKYLSKYYKKNNIRVNCVSPGGIEDNQPKIFKSRYKASCNSKGLLNPTDIVNLIIFLLSAESRYINGQNLVIDDGWSL